MSDDLRRSFDSIRWEMDKVEDDLEKFLNGNNSAGTRLRKAMQEIKGLAQEVRVGVSERKKK